jgi:hypothetical protein
MYYVNHWFQQDGAPPHFAANVRDFLNQEYPNRWIGRGGAQKLACKVTGPYSFRFFSVGPRQKLGLPCARE